MFLINFLKNFFANFLAKRLVRWCFIAGLNAIGIVSVVGVPIAAIIDCLLLFAALHSAITIVSGYAKNVKYSLQKYRIFSSGHGFKQLEASNNRQRPPIV